jgi:hypothetical protein
MTTVRELIQSALRLTSVIGAGENMTAEDATDGLASLNQMLSSWSADGQVIFNRVTDSIPLNAGVANYTMGPGGDIDTTRPIGISQATLNLGVIVYNLDIWSQNTVSQAAFPTLPGIPSELFVNNSNPLIGLRLYPVPIDGLTLNIYSMKPLETLTLNTVLDLPPGFERALRYNLAVEIAPEYEREASRTVQNIAFESLSTIKRNNQQYNQPESKVDDALNPRWMNGDYWSYNIYGGS